MIRRCKYHCRACDSHFTSLAAFDCHRQGTAQERSCADPDTAERLQIVTEQGLCDISGPSDREPVILYEHDTADRLRAVFA